MYSLSNAEIPFSHIRFHFVSGQACCTYHTNVVLRRRQEYGERTFIFHRQQLNRKGTAKGLLVTNRSVSPILLTQRDKAEKVSYEINWEKSLLGESTLF